MHTPGGVLDMGCISPAIPGIKTRTLVAARCIIFYRFYTHLEQATRGVGPDNHAHSVPPGLSNVKPVLSG